METRISLGVDAAEYHGRKLGVVSKSALDKIERSPAHYRAWVDGEEEEPTPAMVFGSAFHMLALEPERFAQTYVVRPDFGDGRTKEAKAAKAEWLATHGDKIALVQTDYDALFRMVASLMDHPAASRLILDGEPEVTLRWQDAETGLQCKARADYYVRSKRLAVDLKSTENAKPDEFARSVYIYRYHVQDALYRAGFAECGEPIEHFALGAVEKKPPYAVAVYTLDANAVGMGYAAARRNIDTMAACMKSGEWPAYSAGVEELSLPRWAV